VIRVHGLHSTRCYNFYVTATLRLSVAALVLALPGAIRAEFCGANPAPQQWRHEFRFFGGYSPVTATLIGVETDRRFALAGFSYSYTCWAWSSVFLSYTGAVMPAAILIEPSHSVYGVAVTPVGFTLDFSRRHRLDPFVEFDGGIIASTEPIPERHPDAAGLNFLFDLGGGVRWKVGPRGAVTLGYKFLHISNAFTTNFNPGVDNNVFYVGYSFLR
jgi:Lipid A 3-O-deacylase (PagL)